MYKLASAQSQDRPGVRRRRRAPSSPSCSSGDAENLRGVAAHGRRPRAASSTTIYARLGVQFDMWRGESAYEDMLPGVVQLLLERGIAREDEGAICVFFEDDPELGQGQDAVHRAQEGRRVPVRTTRHRDRAVPARCSSRTERAIYVVEHAPEAALPAAVRHGAQARRRRCSSSTSASARCWARTASRSRRAPATRSSCPELLDEAEERATKLILRRRPRDRPGASAGAARAASASARSSTPTCHRTACSDYRFDWDKLISFKGNAGPYLQYAHARVAGDLPQGRDRRRARSAARRALALATRGRDRARQAARALRRRGARRGGEQPAAPGVRAPVRGRAPVQRVLRAMPGAEGRTRAAAHAARCCAG